MVLMSLAVYLVGANITKPQFSFRIPVICSHSGMYATGTWIKAGTHFNRQLLHITVVSTYHAVPWNGLVWWQWFYVVTLCLSIFSSGHAAHDGKKKCRTVRMCDPSPPPPFFFFRMPCSLQPCGSVFACRFTDSLKVVSNIIHSQGRSNRYGLYGQSRTDFLPEHKLF